MRNFFGMVVLVCLALGSPAVWSQSVTKEAVYAEFVDKMIDRCERKADMLGASGGNLKGTCDAARARAVYYRTHRDQLIQEMREKDIGNNPTRANVLLINAYKSGAEAKAVARADEVGN